MRVILDPGHGGRDPGACGKTTQEKNNSLILAGKVQKILVANKIQASLTRTSDNDFCAGTFNVDQDLVNRVAVSNNSGADIFISLHNNSGGGRGIEVYAWQSGGKGEKLARSVHDRMLALGMVDRGVKFANWYVVRKTSMPAILVEYGFIDTEEDMILSNMDQAALFIAQGIGDYFGVSVNAVNKEDDIIVDNAILMFTDEDYWAAKDVSAKFGGIAMFVRQGTSRTIPADAMKAKHLFTIGGAATGHPNEMLLSGNNKYDTAAAVGKYLG